jgi:hypothetical protein
MRANYNDYRVLEHTFLEDSFVLDIIENSSELKFVMEVILTENHPLYAKPEADEMYCYKKAEIIFPDCKEVEWIERTRFPPKDSSGEFGYGSIDEFYREKDHYHISGDFGELKIGCHGRLQVNYLTDGA